VKEGANQVLIQVTITPASDRFAVTVTADSGVEDGKLHVRLFKISTLVLAVDAAGVPYWSAGELLEVATLSDLQNHQ
jgi:hypothetical protein